MTERAEAIAAKIERFVRETVIPYERDPRLTAHGPTEELVQELRAKARAAGLMTPHIVADGSHLRSEEHTSELQSLMRISYAVFCLKKKKKITHHTLINTHKINNHDSIIPTHNTYQTKHINRSIRVA